MAVLETVDAGRQSERFLPGLDTIIGSGGTSISPGFAQQIAIARLLLADPHTLVLDEATSLLDSRAARHLERSVAVLLEGRTVIAISHRLHAAHDAEVVVVVEDGRISEYGTHAESAARRWRVRATLEHVAAGLRRRHGLGVWRPECRKCGHDREKRHLPVGTEDLTVLRTPQSADSQRQASTSPA